MLVNTIVAILAERRSLSETQLLAALRRTWQTSTLSDEMTNTALADARRAGLIATRPDKHGAAEYFVAGDAASHNSQDRQYVQGLFSAFKSNIADRLKDYPNEEQLANRLDRIVNEVLTSIAHACQESYDIPIRGSVQTVHPMRLSGQEVRRYARQLDPKSIRQPVEDLAFDALDPADSFGNEIVHLVVVGGLLHGLTSQRGVSVSPSLKHMYLLLDTSALIGIVREEDHPDCRTLTQLISLSKRCEANLVVAEHTIDEWERVWIAADEQFEHAQRQMSKDDAPGVLIRYAQNPFVAAYADHLDRGGKGSWIRWATTRRDLRAQVERLGLTVVTYEDRSDEDTSYREQIHSHLLALSADANVRGGRSKGGAEADAMSAALISRWRRENGDDTAIFIANDYLTNLAFESSASGSSPLVVNPTLWLTVVTYEDRSDEDTSYREQIHSHLLALSADANVRGGRSKGGAEADAMSAALISRWRRENGDDTAIFIANDYLTNLAFESSASGSSPLVVNPTLWLQYVACLLVDDADQRIEIANLIADVGVRDMILGMASTYSLDEIFEISDVLMAEGTELNIREARDLADRRLYQSLDEMHQEAMQHVNVRVQAILSRRTTRSIQRVSNREATLQGQLDSMQGAADEKSRLAEKYKSQAEQATMGAAEDRATAAQALSDKKRAEDKSDLLKRTLYAGAGSVVVLILLIVLASWGFIQGRGILVGVFVWVGGVAAAYSWVKNTAATLRRLLGGIGVQLALDAIISAFTGKF